MIMNTLGYSFLQKRNAFYFEIPTSAYYIKLWYMDWKKGYSDRNDHGISTNLKNILIFFFFS